MKEKIVWTTGRPDGSPPDDLSRQIEWTAMRNRPSTAMCSNDFGFVPPAPPFLNSRYTAMRRGGRVESKATLVNPFAPGLRVRVNIFSLHF